MRILMILMLALAPGMVAAEKLSLEEVSRYFNALGTAQGPFTQINDDGSLSTGKLFIKRPGKMRFEYDPPEAGLVIAANNAVMVQDPRSNQPPEVYELSRTPLSIILARQVDLGRARMVTGHSFDGTATIITAQDPDRPEYGTIQMKFTANPVQLRQWIVNDESGTRTTVILGALQTGGDLPNRLFRIARASSDR